eukprot:1926703-Pyramimonas_sp.AAC.1
MQQTLRLRTLSPLVVGHVTSTVLPPRQIAPRAGPKSKGGNACKAQGHSPASGAGEWSERAFHVRALSRNP